MRSLFAKAVTLFIALGASLGFALPVHSQTMSEDAVKSLISEMMEQPVSLFFGLPVAFLDVDVADKTGEMTQFSVAFDNALVLGFPVGTLVADAEVVDAGSLKLTFDLRDMAHELAEDNESTFTADTLRLSIQIDPKALAAEKVRLVADNVLVGEKGNEAENAIKFDGLIVDWDERDLNELVTFDFGLDGYSMTFDGIDTLALDTVGMSFEIVNTMDWTLQSEINEAFKTFMMVQVGMMSPTEGLASVVEQIIPLLETQQQDVMTSFDIAGVTAQALSFGPFFGDLSFDGLNLVSFYAHEQQYAETSGSIGASSVTINDSYYEEIQPFNVFESMGAELFFASEYGVPYDLNPVADILRDIANDIRGMDPEALFELEPEVLIALSRHVIPLLDWTIETLDTSVAEVKFGPVMGMLPGAFSASMQEAEVGFYTEVDETVPSDAQGTFIALRGINAEVPEVIDLSVGEIGLGYELIDSLIVSRDVFAGALSGELNLADAINLAIAFYLPNFEIGVSDLQTRVPSPVGFGAVEAGLGSALISFELNDMKTDTASVSQRIAFSGLSLMPGDLGLFDPRLQALVLGENGEPGLAPTEADLMINLADIPMAMILDLAQSIPLPPIEELASDDFDPTSLLIGGAALISPILMSPPSVVIPDGRVGGGLIEMSIDGAVAINPMMQPNFSVGSFTVRLYGVREAQAKVMAMLTDLGDDDAALRDQLQQLVGITTMAAGFGMPADDGSLEFVIDVPEGAPANVNGLPIPLGF